MRKSSDLENKVLNSSQNTFESIKSVAKRAAAIGAVGLSLFSGGDALAKGNDDTIKALRVYAEKHESSPQYRATNPGDSFVGLTESETANAKKVMSELPNLEITNLYLLSRDADLVVDARGSAGNLDQVIAKWVPKKFRGSTPAEQQKIVAAIRAELKSHNYDMNIAVPNVFTLPKSALKAGIKASRGMEVPMDYSASYASVGEQVRPVRAQAVHNVSSEYQPVSGAGGGSVEAAAPKAPAKVAKGKKKKASARVINAGAEMPLDIAPEPIPVDPCADASVNSSLNTLADARTVQINAKYDADTILSSYESGVAALESDCAGRLSPASKTNIAHAKTNAKTVVSDYVCGPEARVKGFKSLEDSIAQQPTLSAVEESISTGIRPYDKYCRSTANSALAVSELTAEKRKLGNLAQAYFKKKVGDVVTGVVSAPVATREDINALNASSDSAVQQLYDEAGSRDWAKKAVDKAKADIAKEIAKKNCTGAMIDVSVEEITSPAYNAIALGQQRGSLILSASDSAFEQYKEGCTAAGVVIAPDVVTKVNAARSKLDDRLKVYACEPSELERNIKDARQGTDAAIANEDYVSVVTQSVATSKDNLAQQMQKCQALPQNIADDASTDDANAPIRTASATAIDSASGQLDADLLQYIKDQTGKVRFKLGSVGGEYSGRVMMDQTVDANHLSKLRDTGFGTLNLGIGNARGAETPFQLDLFGIGGKIAETVDRDNAAGTFTRNTQRPYGGFVLDVGGAKYKLQLSWAGVGYKSNSNTEGAPLAETTTGSPDGVGTQTDTVTTRDSQRSSTEGMMLNDWFVAADGNVQIGEFLLDLGFGYGRYAHHELTASRSESSTSSVYATHDAGPPAVDVTSQSGADVTTDTRSLTDVLTHFFAAKLGGAYKGENWTIGGQLGYFHDMSDISNELSGTVNTRIHDTITDVNIEGFAPEQDITPGSETVSPIGPETSTDKRQQGRAFVRARVLYDTEKMALRLEPMAVFGFHDNSHVKEDKMPVQGNLTGIFDINTYTLGANIAADPKFLSLEAMFATNVDFKKFVGYVDSVNTMRQVGIIDDRLRDQYLQNMYDNLVRTNEGFIVTLGAKVDPYNNQWTFMGSAAYNHQFGFGPLGASYAIEMDSQGSKHAVRANVGLTNGFSLTGQADYTDSHPITDGRDWGVGLKLNYDFSPEAWLKK